jgi:hydrogenase maturation protein HypF
LKNTITLVVAGQAFVSQHIGDLDHYESAVAFDKTVEDLMAMYEVRWDDVLLVHDAHPEYHSTVRARNLPPGEKHAIQHHRAHIASVLAEENAWETRVVGVSLDGTGYGDDGTIWGGEIFVGSVAGGFDRAAHLRPAALAGGDAAAQHPVQAAAGFLAQLDDLPDVTAPPFHFPTRFARSMELISKGVRTFTTTSIGRMPPQPSLASREKCRTKARPQFGSNNWRAARREKMRIRFPSHKENSIFVRCSLR